MWHRDRSHFCTGEDEQKARNLESNRRVVVVACSSAYDQADIVIEGLAERASTAELLTVLAARWNEKYDNMFGFEAHGDKFKASDGNSALVFGVRHRKIFGFAKLPRFGQTRFQF